MLVGRLTANPVLLITANDKTVCDMWIAVNDQPDYPARIHGYRHLRPQRRSLRATWAPGSASLAADPH
jgi:hypothetical protein